MIPVAYAETPEPTATPVICNIEEQGVPFKKESINLEEAAKTISLGNLTWIEVVVDDIVAETPQIFA